ncbi:MAG: ABC transporter ATP-binding protein [Candidatus Sericytochromatia bacterium]
MSEKNIIFRLKDISKRYVMGEVVVNALNNINIDIFEGEFLVILGTSGSGKSTLLNIIGGMDNPSTGQIFFKEQDLSKYNQKKLTYYRREHIGFVFQFYNLIPTLTAKENVDMAREISKKPANSIEMLKMVGLEGRENHFPSQMSGGEQQRVAIARATAKRPEVLLCDEPTGALDFNTGKKVLHFLQKINKDTNTTLIVITHNIGIADIADRVIKMRDGGIKEITINENPVSADEVIW